MNLALNKELSYMKRSLYILLVITLYCSCKHFVSPADAIIADYTLLSRNQISVIHSQLKNIPKVIDSVKLAEVIDTSDSIHAFELGDKYMDIVASDWSNFIRHFDTLYLYKHKRDSLINLLALDSYMKAYCSQDEKNNKVPILQRIANVYKRQNKLSMAKAFYQETFNVGCGSDSLTIVSLDGFISCSWNKYETNVLLSPDTAKELYPLQKELIDLQYKLYPSDTLTLFKNYADLAYLGYICHDEGYMENCKKAISLAESYQSHNSYSSLEIWLINISYKSPYLLLGDYYLQQHEYLKALNSYNQITLINPNTVNPYNPDTMFADIVEKKSSALYNYPLRCVKQSICYQATNNDLYKKYLYEAFYEAVYDIIFNFGKSPESFTIELSKHNLVFDYICNDSDARWAYNSVLFRKGLSINIESDIKQHVDSALYEKYLRIKEIARMNADNLHIFNEMRDMEVEIFDTYHNRKWLSTLLYTYKDVENAVKKNRCIAIEFTTTSTIDETELRYIALVIDDKHEEPYKIELCKTSELQSIISTNNLLRVCRRDNTYNERIAELYSNGYNLIWSKLEPYINEGDNVYFSPDGLLHQINIEVLQDANGRRANEKWNLHRVSSTRELCMAKPEIEKTSAVLYGGLTYDMDNAELVSQSRATLRTDKEPISRGFVADSIMRAGWSTLPATKKEIDAIEQMLKAHSIKVETYANTIGNEESFKALSGKKTPIIHLATHGFFYKNDDVNKKPFLEQICAGSQNYFNPDNSLKRSGLILAGAQRAWLGEQIPDSVEDGILLSEEIATMDLTGTDLVVLSACETGLGEITSEGVFGLQRAFKKAGVQTLIMSLWKVNDNATSLFMQTFYKHWLGGKTKHEAFAMAQKAMQEHKDFSNPYYWAAFIMLD